MKNIGLYFIISLLIINLTGCSLPTAPSNLIKPPIADEENIELKKNIERFLSPNARLTIPFSQEKTTQAFFLADVTGDGKEEVIAFYKIDNSFSLGVLILTKDQDNKWREIGRAEEYGEDIDLVKLLDITGDKLPELLVGFSSGSSLDKQLFIYSFTPNKMQEIANLPYSNLTTGNIKGENLPEIVISKNERRNDIPNTVVEVYEYKEENLTLFYATEFEGYPGELLIGQASPNVRGLFVEVYLGAHSAASYLLAYIEGQLVSVLAEDNEDIPCAFKPYPLPAKDVNGDGIIEIGIHQAPPGSEKLAMVEIPWVESWYKWDGESGIEWVCEVYADYGLGYEWRIPVEWQGKYTLTRENKEKSSRVEFYDLTNHQHRLFTLLSIETELWEAEAKRLEQKGNIYELLGENQLLGKVYVAILPEPRTCRCFLPITITLEEIEKRFEVIEVN